MIITIPIHMVIITIATCMCILMLCIYICIYVYLYIYLHVHTYISFIEPCARYWAMCEVQWQVLYAYCSHPHNNPAKSVFFIPIFKKRILRPRNVTLPPRSAGTLCVNSLQESSRMLSLKQTCSDLEFILFAVVS